MKTSQHDSMESITSLYERDKKECAIPDSFRDEIMHHLDIFNACDPHDINELEKKLTISVPALLAYALWHFTHLSPSYFTPEEIRQRQELLKHCMQQKGIDQKKFFKLVTESLPKSFPRIFSLALLSTYPIDHSLLNSSAEKKLTSFVFESLFILRDAGKKGCMLFSKLVSSNDRISTFISMAEVKKVDQELAKLFPQGFFHSASSSDYSFVIGRHTVDFELFSLLQALGRNGCLNWAQFFDAQSLEQIQQVIEARIINKIAYEIDKKSPNKKKPHWPSANRIQEVHIGEFHLNGTSIDARGSFRGIDLMYDHSGGPLEDFRFNIEIDATQDAHQALDRIALPIRAIAETVISGMPIHCKVALSDLNDGKHIRLLIYADYETCKRIILTLKRDGYGAMTHNPIMRVDASGHGKKYLHPFGNEINIRTTDETGQEYDQQRTDVQLEALKKIAEKS